MCQYTIDGVGRSRPRDNFDKSAGFLSLDPEEKTAGYGEHTKKWLAYRQQWLVTGNRYGRRKWHAQHHAR
jgi:hypothetical protein